MKKILLILMLFTPIITWGQKSDLIKFLDACKTFEFEESKEIISKYSFNLGNMYDLLNYEEPTGILFDTDTLNIKGYKAIINCKIKNKAGHPKRNCPALFLFLYIDYEFILIRNSSLSLVFSKRSFTKSIASIGFMSDRYLRSIHILSRVCLSSNKSSRRVLEATMLTAGKIRLFD